MNRLIAALVILLACAYAPISHAQDDCDEQALEAGECGGEGEGAGDEGAESDVESEPSE